LFCVIANKAITYLAEIVLVQHFCAPADYYRPSRNPERFYEKSIFLPELNNEKLDSTFYPWVTPEEKAAKQKENLL